MLRFIVLSVCVAWAGAQTTCCAQAGVDSLKTQVTALLTMTANTNNMIKAMQDSMVYNTAHQYYIYRNCGTAPPMYIIVAMFPNPTRGWNYINLPISRKGQLSVKGNGILLKTGKEIHFTLGATYFQCALFSVEDDAVNPAYDHHIATDGGNNCPYFKNKGKGIHCAQIRNVGKGGAVFAPCEEVILRCYKVPSIKPWSTMNQG